MDVTEQKKEFILCAANWYNDGKHYETGLNGPETGFVLCGHRHHSIIRLLPECPDYNAKDEESPVNFRQPTDDYEVEQGFLTSTGRFVTREDALQIAIAAGQIDKGHYSDTMLFSEDLY